jgi:hypothetical protein
MKYWYMGRLQIRETLRRNVEGAQTTESMFFFRRGLLSLIEGDIAGARKRFEQSRVPAVKDWDLPEKRNPQAERLLRLIGKAQRNGK